MRQTFLVICLTLLGLVGLDLAVGAALRVAEAQNRLGSLVQYFDYGRSVPGKLEAWRSDPAKPGNLQEVAWRTETLESSATSFAAETGAAPVVRSYGMSFVNRILDAAQDIDPNLTVDAHAAPAGSPNFTYAMFLDDAAARRPGDVAVLGILSSSLPALAALSNATWSFEQPAPFTYPIFRPAEDGGLSRTDPVLASYADYQRLPGDAALSAAWTAQLAEEDAFYSPITYGLSSLDASPFLRLVRRALAKSHVADTEAALLADGFPKEDVLRRMITEFATTARSEGLRPVVMLIQSARPADPDLLALAAPVLAAQQIPYLATTEHADPANPALFEPDGHYIKQIDTRFAEAFLKLLDN